MKTKFSIISFLLIIGLIISYQKSFGQSAVQQLQQMAGKKLSDIHVPTPTAQCVSCSAASSLTSQAANLNSMVVGTIFQSLLGSLFSDNSAAKQQQLQAQQQANQLAAQQAAEQKRIADSIAQANFNSMMKTYKTLDSQQLTFKTLDNSNSYLENLNGSDEALRAAAQKQFEPDGGSTNTTPINITNNATPFFGDSMPIADVQTLAEPESNPNVVDLREANKYVAEKVATDSLNIVSLLRNNIDANGSPIIDKIKCVDVSRKLNAFLNQRNKFQKTILLSQNELETWETANNNALINAAKDGLEYFTGQFLEVITHRGLAAERLQGILNKNAKQMAKKGINVADIQAKINNLKALSTAGQLADLTTKMNDWSSFVKDGMSSLLTNLTNSNNEINQFFEDPDLKKYFETEKPELNTLLDISKIAASNAVFGKWVAKKVPMIGLVDISIKQIYNATDWITSYYRITKARQINGGVLDAAKYIQQKIDASYVDLKNCSD